MSVTREGGASADGEGNAVAPDEKAATGNAHDENVGENVGEPVAPLATEQPPREPIAASSTATNAPDGGDVRARQLRVTLSALAVLVVGVYAGYMLLMIWRAGWTGDNHVYLAGVRELLESWRPTRHEYLDLPASESYAYTPYLYWAALVGRVLGLPPYETLQVNGVINLVLYISGVFTLLSSGVWRQKQGALFTGALFLLVSSLLRQETFFMSSETALATWGYVLHYPSGFSWCAFLWGMIAAERIAERRYAWAPLLALCVFMGLTSHPLTGSWLFGVAGVRGLFAIFDGPRDARRERLLPAAVIIATVLVAAASSALWPNVSFLKSSIVAASAPTVFTDRPFMPFVVVYILAAVALARGLRERERTTIWLLVGWCATAFAYLLMIIPNWDYRARYVFFALFFAQMLVSGRYASDIVAFLHALITRRFERRLLIPALCTLAFVLAFVASPQDRLRRPPPSVRTLMSLPAGGDQVRRELDPIREHIGPKDIFIAESLTLGMRLSAISGGRPVAAKYAAQVPSMPKRLRDVRNFYDLEKDRATRAKIARKYKVTKVVIGARHRKHIKMLTAELGKPIASSDYLHIFDPAPYYRPAPAEEPADPNAPTPPDGADKPDAVENDAEAADKTDAVKKTEAIDALKKIEAIPGRPLPKSRKSVKARPEMD